MYVYLHTRREIVVAKQQITEGEIRRLVLGPLPLPEAVPFDDESHRGQFVRVIYTGHVDEASLGVNLTDEVGSGLGKHCFSRRGLQTAGKKRRHLKLQFELILSSRRQQEQRQQL